MGVWSQRSWRTEITGLSQQPRDLLVGQQIRDSAVMPFAEDMSGRDVVARIVRPGKTGKTDQLIKTPASRVVRAGLGSPVDDGVVDNMSIASARCESGITPQEFFRQCRA
jgi:hypothetical protein